MREMGEGAGRGGGVLLRTGKDSACRMQMCKGNVFTPTQHAVPGTVYIFQVTSAFFLFENID